MSVRKPLVIFYLALALSLAVTGTGLAQEAQPPTPPEPFFLPEKFPAGGGLELQNYIQAEPDVSAQDFTLGTAGLSFRYLKSFGHVETPYIGDTAHLNHPWGVATDGANVLIGEYWGKRVLKYTSAGVHLSTIGRAGIAYSDGELWNFSDMAVDSSGNTWGLGTDADSVAKFDSSNNFVEYFHDGEDLFDSPAGIAFDGADNVYISDGGAFWNDDIGHHHVLIFNSAGAQIGQIGVTDVKGSDNVHLYGPQHITVYGNLLYIADGGNERVQIFNISTPSAPTYAGTLGVTGEAGIENYRFNHPVGVAVDANYIYVADRWNQRVQIFWKSDNSYAATIGVTEVAGSNNAHFNSPTDVAVDSAGNIYVADFANQRVQQFNSSRVYQRTYGVTGVPYLTADGYYNSPSDVAVAFDGSMYITEDDGHRLIKLNPNGTPAWTVGYAGVKGDWSESTNDRLNNPADIAISLAGKIYVADRWHSRVQVFNSNGTYAATLGGKRDGNDNLYLDCPSGLAIAKNGYIYVADPCRQRVQVFTAAHAYVGTLGVTDVAGSDNAHFNDPQGVAVDNNGFIYVADSGNHRVQVFNSSRVLIRTMGGGGSWNFPYFNYPTRLAVDAQNRLYVSDAWNNRVQVFDSTGAYLTSVGGNWGNQSSKFRNPQGLTVDSSGALYVADSQNHRIQKYVIGTPNWEQVNLNGFGQRANGITSMTPFGGKLYASTYNTNDPGAQLWRSADGKNWSNVMEGGFGDETNVGIDHLLEFKGNLYAGVWNQTDTGTNGGQIWRSAIGDSGTWTKVVENGFGEPTINGEIMRMAVFNDKIYAGTWSYDNTKGTEIWSSSSGDIGTWTKVVDNGMGDADNREVLSMETFNGYLYAGVQNWNIVNETTTGCKIWRTANGADWTQVVSNGFGVPNCYYLSLVAFGDSLYYSGTAQTWTDPQTSSGGQIWKCTAASECDAESDWTLVMGNGFGNPENHTIESMRVFGNQLYAIAANSAAGLEVWQTDNGTDWQNVGSKGFGDSNNSTTYWDNSTVIFDNRLFVGTTNWANGGEIWATDLPPISSITRLDTSPTNLSSVRFSVVFSKPVTGVDTADFKLTNIILTGASITEVIGSGDTYTVTVNTGSGNGMIRLDLSAMATIQIVEDGSALSGPYAGGASYSVRKGTAPSTPVLLSPAANALVTSAPMLDWKDSAEVMALAVNPWSYEVNITSAGGYDHTFNTAGNAAALLGLGDSSFTIQPADALPANTTFTWKVRAYNDENQYSAWSAARAFRTKLAAPALTLPLDQVSPALNNKRPTFEWNEVSGATTYTLQILNGTKVAVTGTIKAPLHAYTPAVDLLPNTPYTWKVKANGVNAGDYSAPFGFLTSPNPPLVPVLFTPANGAILDNTVEQKLIWKPSLLVNTSNPVTFYPAAASYQVEYATNSAFVGATAEVVTGDVQLVLSSGTLLPNRAYFWRVRSWSEASAGGNHSVWSAARAFRTEPPLTPLTAPVLNLPADLTTLNNKRPTFEWGEVVGATSYTIQVFSGAKIAVTGVVNIPAHTYTPKADLLPNTTYTWQVKANGLVSSAYSTQRTFTTSLNAPKVPVLVAPAANAFVDSAVLQTLDWNPVIEVNTTNPVTTYPEAVSYDVEYATDKTFAGSALVNVVADQYEIPDLLPANTIFYWRVRSYNNTGQYSAWSVARIFKTRLATPELTLPVDLAVLDNKRPTFEWEEIPGAISYTLLISKENPKTHTFTLVAHTATIKAPAYVYTPAVDLLAGTQYKWQVKANGVNAGLYSAPFSFTTGVNPPKPPVQSLPKTGTIIPVNTDATLTWLAPIPVFNANLALAYPAAVSYDVQVSTNAAFADINENNNVKLLNVDTLNTTLSAVLATGTDPDNVARAGRTYYWRVRSWSAADHHSAWSAVRALSVKFAAPELGAVTLVADKLVFDWHSANGLWTSYTLQILNPTTNRLVKSFIVPAPTTTHTIPVLPPGDYLWQVTINGLYTPIKSATQTFNVP